MTAVEPPADVIVEPDGLPALLGVPESSAGLVIFAHGSGSGRKSPRNTYVAERLRHAGMATLLLDLLTPEEEQDRRNVFDIPLLASRLTAAKEWTSLVRPIRDLPLGLFGASTGAGAALLAASTAPGRLAAVVSRGGRPDLAGSSALARVRAPTLLIVGSRDLPVIELNRTAMAHLTCEHELVIVPGAHHLFEEPGTLDAVVDHAARWFLTHFEARR
jgi:dienelactone hydrolase